jgi:hypothetical protein
MVKNPCMVINFKMQGAKLLIVWHFLYLWG